MSKRPLKAQRLVAIVLISALVLSGLPLSPPAQAATSSLQSGGDQVLSNEDLSLRLYGSGVFTLASADDRALLFPAGTSYVSVWVDGAAYTGSPVALVGGNTISREEGPRLTGSNQAEEVFITAEGVRFTLTYSLVGPAVRFSVRAQNEGAASHRAKTRYLLDTQVDENDGSPLWSSGSVYTAEAEVSPSTTIFKGYDKIPEPDFTSTGMLVTRPERMAFVHWPTAVDYAWDYTLDPGQSFYTPGYTESPLSDSAVLLYYDLGELAPGASAEAEFYYGLAVPEEEAAADTLLLELERTRGAIQARIDADLDRLAEIHTRTYRAVYGHTGPPGIVDSLTSGVKLGEAAIFFGETAHAGELVVAGVGLAGKLILAGMREETKSDVEEALPAIYRDLALEPSDPTLPTEVRSTLDEYLGFRYHQQEIDADFAELEQTIREDGLPPDYPIERVVAALRAYRSQLELTSDQEALLLWPGASQHTTAYQPSGLLAQHLRFSQALEDRENLAGGLQWTGYALKVGVVVGLGLKICAAVATAGASIPLETVVTVAAVGGTALSLGGGAVEESAVERHAFAAVQSAIVASVELYLLEASAGDVVSAIEDSLSDATGWNAEGAVVRVALQDIILSEGEDVGTAQGSVTVRNTGDADAEVSLYATVLGPTSTDRAPIAMLDQPEPVTVRAGEEQEIAFEYGAPDTRLWRQASAYPVDLWVSIGYGLIHVSDNPDLAGTLQVLVGSRDAVELLRYGDQTVIHAADLSEDEFSRREFTISPDAATTTLDLSYTGSDFDLHLYDMQGNHVGLNYDTGQIDAQIADVTYSGPSARPEWMEINGRGGETFEVEVVAVQAEVPERFTVVSRELPAFPGMLGADPLDIFVSESPPDTIEAELAVYEYGGQSGVSGITGQVESLESEGGRTISGDEFELDLPRALDAGETASGSVRLGARSLRPGTYSGIVRLSGVDAASGASTEASARLQIYVPGEDGPGDGGDGAGLGLAVALVVVAVAGLAVYGLVRRQQRRPVAAGEGAVGPAVVAPASLFVIHESGAGQQIPLSGSLTIGRAGDNAVRLADTAVSRRHAVIRYAQGRWFIQDQGSTVGTFVNGQRVDATALSNGDRVRIGDTEFEFRSS